MTTEPPKPTVRTVEAWALMRLDGSLQQDGAHGVPRLLLSNHARQLTSIATRAVPVLITYLVPPDAV